MCFIVFIEIFIYDQVGHGIILKLIIMCYLYINVH